MKKIKSVVISMMFALFGAAALAATVTKDGVTITYNGGTATTLANGDLLLQFKTVGTGSFSLPCNATADILVVGGGGSGGRSNDKNSAYYGGSGGVVTQQSNYPLPGGSYSVSVGNGGAAQTTNGRNGNAGTASSLTGGSVSLTADGGAGGTNSQGTDHSTTSSITGTSVTYGQRGGRNANPNGGANTGNGGKGTVKNTNSGAGGSGIVVVRITSIKEQVDCGSRTVAVGEAPVTIPYDTRWGNDWTVSADDGTKVAAEKVGDTVRLTGVAYGATTVRVETADKIYCYTVYVAEEPYVVRFCEGDSVQIWYNDPTPGATEWFLLINDTRYALNQTGTGNQMQVTLSKSGTGDNNTYIIGNAVTPGAAADGDLVVISDGDRYYAYRMSVDQPREIAIGETAQMVCKTVAVNPWLVEIDDMYKNFVSATCTGGGTPSHETTATITGLDLTDEAYVKVRDDQYISGEQNAQGAVYTLKVAVTGAPRIGVNLSAGVTMPVAWGARDATDATAYSVVVSNAQSCLSAAFTPGRDTGTSFELNLSAEGATAADFGKTAFFTVMADGEPVVTYQVKVTFDFMMTVGQVAAGFLTGVEKTPWVTRSTAPDVVSVKPVLYSQLNSGEARALKEGDVTFYSTNAYWQAEYWGIHATVADTHTTNISMPMNSSTNIAVVHTGQSAGIWTVKNSYTNLVDVTLPAQGAPSKEITVTVDSKNISGPVTFQVLNGYHVEYINVFVDSATSAGKTKILVPGKIQVVRGSTVTLPADCVSSAWTASSVLPEIADVTASSGAAGTAVRVTGLSAAGKTPDGKATSETLVSVENEDTIFVYQIAVVLPEEEVTNAGTINVGQTIEMSAARFGNVTSATSLDPLVASVSYDPATQTVTTRGLQEGATQIKVETPDKIYYINIAVRNAHIDKHIELVLSEDHQTKSSYSYTFDAIRSIENNQSAVEITRDGNTLTFTPLRGELNETNAQVRVRGYVDDLQTETELHYWFTVREIPSGMNIWEDKGSDAFIYGYVTYSGASKVIDNGTDLILIYTNADDIGQISIPNPYSARVDILAVGGGGAGGSAAGFGLAGGGGGAGGFNLVTNRVLETGDFTVVVGKGGLGGAEMVISEGGVQGRSGQASILTNAFGYAFARAIGGGGGGGPGTLTVPNGLSGGSGGGAAANGTPGRGTDGQGRAGAAPADSTIGGGGGGAGGAGGADRSAGAGKWSDISGENTLYAQGGAGGRAFTQTPAQDGQGPGFGGEGGNAGPGGSGADGLIIVHIQEVYRNIKVPVPGTNDVAGAESGTLLQAGLITPRFVWENGKQCVAFDIADREFRSSTDAHPRKWADVIESITGVTSTNCFETGEYDAEGNPVLGGVGYYNFTIRLKEGYSWEDGLGSSTSGSTSAKSFRWAVVADESVVTAAIDVHKTVFFTDGSNATVRVTTYTSPETAGKHDLNVLFMGSLCRNHSLTDQTIQSVMENLVSKANVDWYFYNNSETGYANTSPYRSGHFDKDGAVTGLPTLGSSLHFNLMPYLNLVADKLDPESPNYKNYDYVVLEFDSDRLFEKSSAYDSNLADRVARSLKPYYEGNSIIWVVDNSPSGNPWGSTSGFWYTPTSWNKDNPSGMPVSGSWNYVVALLDPVLFLGKENGKRYARTLTSGGTTFYAANKYATQVTYDDPQAVLDLLNTTIKVKPYNLSLKDKIVSPEKGLTLTGVTIQVCTNGSGAAVSSASEDPADWADLITWNTDGSVVFTPAKGIEGASIAVNMTSNLIQSVISNVDFQVWTRVNMNVVDDGVFRTSQDAVYNQRTGKWEKNPNEGKAYAEMIDSLGMAMDIDGDADTETPWTYTAYPVTVEVYNGEAFIDGVATSGDSYGEGASPVVTYRAKPGYRLKSVTVDGESVDITQYPYSYTFAEISAAHNVVIEYVAYFGSVISHPVTNIYDGVMHFYDVDLVGWDEGIRTEVRYAPVELKDLPSAYTNAAAFAEIYGTNAPAYNPDELTDVGDHVFCYRVFAYQQGYGRTIGEEGWAPVDDVWFDTEKYGSDHSVITPAQLDIRPNDSEKIAALTPLPEIGYTVKGFISGEDISVLGGEADGWKVLSVYKTGDGLGMYETWVARDAASENPENHPLHDKAIPDGDPALITPDADDSDGNVGNYYFTNEDNFQPVERIPFSIGDVQQGPGLDPENPLRDTGVEPAKKMYDGGPTGVVVTVTSLDGGGQPLVENEDYRITYAIADPADPKSPTNSWDSVNPQFTHAGTYVVWYMVEPIGEQLDVYFTASNYQYVVISPRPLELSSHDKIWEYTGETYSYDYVTLDSGTLADGDTLSTNTTATIIHAGTVTNTFDWAIVNKDGEDVRDDYTVTTHEGKLTVTPIPVIVGGVTYPTDPTQVVPYGKSGVDDIKVTYNGEPTNIVVNVDRPGEYVIYYSTNYTGAATTEWTTEPFVFTDVTDTPVFFKVVPAGEHPEDYIPGTGYARVVIDPRPVTVKVADEIVKKGADEPTHTIESIEGVLPGDEGKIVYDGPSCPTYGQLVNTVNPEGYPDVIIATGDERQGNYVVTFESGSLTVIDYDPPEPLIAEFTLSVDNGTLQTMRIWAPNVESGDIIYLAGAATFADAKAGKWTPLVNSSNDVATLTFGADRICAFPDIALTTSEKARAFRFFRPYILSKYGPVCPGRKYVGIVDVAVDDYGETAAGVPFVRCLSETPDEEIFRELRPYAADIPLTELVQTNTLRGSDNAMAADKYYTLPKGNDDVVNWYYLAQDGTWTGIPDAATAAMPVPACSNILVRGTGFSIKREEKFVTDGSVIRLHGQVSETPAEWPSASVDLVMLSNGLPEDLDLNDKVYGVPGDAGASITYMTQSDYTYVLSYDGAIGWYYKKAAMVNGRRTQQKIASPLIEKGRVFWFKTGTSPATPVADTYK